MEKEKITHPVARLIHNALQEFGPLTCEEIHQIIRQDAVFAKDRYPIRTIESVLLGHSPTRHWSGWYDRMGPLVFECIWDSNSTVWKLSAQPQFGEIFTDPAADAGGEVDRQKRLGEIATRPGQREFSAMIRQNYAGTCTVTGCQTPAALEAAHIQVYDGRDDNSPNNGILLRADIHALFDALLITLAEDGRSLEVSADLLDPTYAFLREVEVAQPPEGPPPSSENIRNHRQRFMAQERGDLRMTNHFPN